MNRKLLILPVCSVPGIQRKSLLVITGLLLGAILGEIGLRLAGYSYPEFYMADESRGYQLRPGMEGWYSKEGESYIRINSDGLRDREHSRAKPENTIRIAVIGDSYPEAFPVSTEEAFWAVMEKHLQQCGAFPGKNVEVLNFGVSGYGTAQELITVREHVWAYSPDIVVLTVTTNNDISDNARALKKTDEIPYYVYRDGKLTLDDSFRTSTSSSLRESKIFRFGGWIRDHLRLVQVANAAYRGCRLLLMSWRSRSNSSAAPGPQNAKVLDRSAELGIDNLVYLPPGDVVWNDAWQVTEGLIRVMRDEVGSHGARFVLVTLSNGPQVLPTRQARQAFMQRMGIGDLFYPDMRLKSLADREGIPVITLAPPLQEYAERNHVFLHGFGSDIGNGHWNATGHNIAGVLIAHKLCEGLLK